MWPAPIGDDLEQVLARAERDLERLRGARLFVTGGTGFIGKWLVAALAHADARLGLGLHVLVLSRGVDRFLAAHPEFGALPSVSFAQGDVRSLPPIAEPITHVVHAATDVADTRAASDPRATFETCVAGTAQVCRLAAGKRVDAVLMTSSGAVYGPQPADLERLPENHPGGPDPLLAGSAYGEGKRAAEWLLCQSGREAGHGVRIARIFALAGPWLASGGPFAIGNFVRDAIAGSEIRIAGDGRPLRSYLYASDLAAWLLAILVRGDDASAYNVGSEHAVSIAGLAAAVRDTLGSGSAIVVGSAAAPGPAPRYVPSTRKARAELGLAETVPLSAAIGRMALHYRGSR